ncbi:MAG: GIY-YIG nuclease family protein [Chitinophagales bacterium]|nr:GIY-YIG nuclease family protein [Chitinophagales bacterium]
MYFVYILYSSKFDKYYIGQTNNLSDRLTRHNAGSVKSTKPYLPWILELSIEKDSRRESMELERKLNNLGKEK